MSKKLVIVSNRLPVAVKRADNGSLIFSRGEGGLATAMRAVAEKQEDSVWVGWPGIASDDLTKSEHADIVRELKKHNCHPVFLTQKEVDLYYSGYSNATLWPLFHYFPERMVNEDDYWDAYKSVNHTFYTEMKNILTKDSLVWIHDYQLMLLPELVRAARPDALIGFFLHIPFPSYEIYRLLPQRKDLLRGLLGADVIGFHTYSYARHFMRSVQHMLGYEPSLGTINLDDRVVHTDAFPISIDYKKFAKNPGRRSVKKLAKSFDLLQQKHKVVLSVDRADYSKGIPQRLDAFECLLEKYPNYRENVVMFMLAIPSRTDVDEYQELRAEIEQKVSRINGRFSTVDWTPITYMYQSIPFDDLTALYAESDVMLVTPLRDGMNLVAKEYVAAHHKKAGMLVLSEMAGAASELTESVMVNPHDTQKVADRLDIALRMPVKEQKKRMRAMQQRIESYDVFRWADDFMNELERSHNRRPTLAQALRGEAKKEFIREYKHAEKRLLLIDYDGTLREFVDTPDSRAAKPSLELRELIRTLQKDPKNTVVIVSGRPKTALASFFKGLKDYSPRLVAEHGAWVFKAGKWVKSSLVTKKWQKEFREMMQQFVDRTPNAELEVKDYSLVWHYRRVTPDLAFVRKEELKMELQSIAKKYDDIQVFEGQKMLEVKAKAMHKGAVTTELLASEHWDFILAAGDDYTDEDMFRALPESASTIRVGENPRETAARYHVESVAKFKKLLTELS